MPFIPTSEIVRRLSVEPDSEFSKAFLTDQRATLPIPPEWTEDYFREKVIGWLAKAAQSCPCCKAKGST